MKPKKNYLGIEFSSMPLNLLKNYFFSVLLLSAGIAKAQKNIVISDSLAANAEKLNVKLGSKGIGKIWKMHFGDYGVVSSKTGWETNSSKGNLFRTRIENKSTVKFSFIFSNKTTDSAWVNAANNIIVKALQDIELFPGFTWGSDELLSESKNFSAFITINRDTSDTWALYMNEDRGSETVAKSEAFLTNGARKITISPVISEKKGNNPFMQPPAGYEFFENGQSLSALQYFSGPGMNNDMVWLNRNLDSRLKLILAATMTAILQLKMTEMLNASQ
jgi:hypothetical protein